MEISDYWSYRDTAAAFSKLREAESLIEGDNFLKGLHAFYKAGIYYDKNISKSQELYMKAENFLKTFSSEEAFYYRAKLWHNYGALEQMKGNNMEFLDITLKKCIPLAEKSKNKELLAGYYVDMGMIFNNSKEYDKSIDYIKKAVGILEKNSKRGEGIVWAYLNLATVYLEIGELALVEDNILKAEKALERLPHSQYNVFLYQLKSKYYNKIGKQSKALNAIQKGIDLAKKMNLDYDFLSLSYEKYNYLKNSSQYLEAQKILSELLDKKMGSKKNRLILLNEMAELQKIMGNYKDAYSYLEQFKFLNDTIQTENEKIQILDLEAQYKNKEQQKEIQHLEERNKQERVIFWISLFLFISVGVLMSYALYERKRKNKHKLVSLEQERKIDINKALIYGENKERERIAKELHDGIGGRMTGIKINLENMMESEGYYMLEKPIAQLDKCITELRNTLRNLTSETLHKFGLEEALRDFCQNIQTDYLKISCYTKNLNQIKEKHQLHIYRIVQEGINNAIKHSGATQILVQCTFEENLLLIDIEDNGKGFDVQNIQRNLGLHNIERRVNALDGTLKIESSLGKGTVMSIEAKIE